MDSSNIMLLVDGEITLAVLRRRLTVIANAETAFIFLHHKFSCIEALIEIYVNIHGFNIYD